MPKPIVTIEQWGVVQSVIFPTYDELQAGNHLTGHVFAHTYLGRETVVCTSPIVSVDFSQRIVETLYAIYRLGEPGDEYQAWFRKQRAAA